MKSNMGIVDRSIRLLIAVVIAGLYVGNAISGIVAIVALVLAGIFIATSFVSFCPLYWPFGISTASKNK